MAYTNGGGQPSAGGPAAARMSDRGLGGNQHQQQHSAENAPSGRITFQRAVKRDAKLRFAVCGPSGSGKTYTLLKLAAELGGPVALVDTERGSASKYADLFEFDVLELDSYDPLRLIEIIDYAAANRYRVLCIDSLSHFWSGKDGELDKVDRAARRMQNPNSFAAWKQVTPIHNALIDKIVSAPLHILASMRSKTEWVLDRDEKTGKTTPRRLGLAPMMRDGIEYEFDVCGDMDHENTLQITKSRCPKLTGGSYARPGKELAEALKEWLASAPSTEPTIDGHSTAETRVPCAGSTNPVGPKTETTNGADRSQPSYMVPEELVSIWRRMCSPRSVTKEFEALKREVESLAGAAGRAEFHRILRENGVNHAQDFKSAQPARICAKQIYALLSELRANASENQAPGPVGDGADSVPNEKPREGE